MDNVTVKVINWHFYKIVYDSVELLVTLMGILKFIDDKIDDKINVFVLKLPIVGKDIRILLIFMSQ